MYTCPRVAVAQLQPKNLDHRGSIRRDGASRAWSSYRLIRALMENQALETRKPAQRADSMSGKAGEDQTVASVILPEIMS